MSEQFVDVLLDGTSIRENIVSFRLQRPRNRATDTLTLRLADFSLYSQFDFALIPLTERLHVGTSTASPKTDGSTVGTNIFTSAGSDFTAEGVTLDDIIFVIQSTESADLGGHEITVVGTTTLTSSFTFGTASSIRFIILTNQGRFFVEKPDVIESEEDIAIPSLWGRNGLARMTDPFIGRLTKTFTRKQNFSDLVTELVTGAGMDPSKIIIDIDDFIIPGNLLTISNQLPLDVLTNIARKTNGYIRSQKTGDIHIKKDFLHFLGQPISLVVGDDEVREFQERTDFPTFGNRVLVRSVTPEAAQDLRISLSLATSCTRGDGRQPVPARAVVTNQRGLPISDGTPVDWDITSADGVDIVFTVAHGRTLTRSETIIDEEKRSSSLLTVSTEDPIREVIGVYLKLDTRKQTNFFTSGASPGSFQGTSITLARSLPFSNTLVFVDYVAGGIAKNTIRSFAGVAEGTVNFVNAAVGRIRDTRTLCINNNRNITINMTAEPSEFNLCLLGSHTGTITAVVADNGIIGSRLGIFWSLVGLGSLSSSFTMVRNTGIDSENQTSRNLFTVSTKYDIASVVGVFRADDGKSGTNHFTQSQDRSGSFDEREITLGTNLPFNRDRVIIEYVAKSITQVGYTAPEDQTGPSVVQIITRIDDGTALGITEAEEILLNFRCPDENGVIPGVDPSTGLPSEPTPDPDCDDSTAAAKACNIGDPTEQEFTECICGFLLSGGACPDDEEECRTMCQEDYNANGRSSMLCDVETRDQFCRRETGNVSLSALSDCRDEHEPSTVDACVQRCLDHDIEEEAVEELMINPASPIMDCGVGGTIQLEAVGGSPPYTWEITAPEGTPNLVVGGQDDRIATISPQPDESVLADNFKAFHRNVFFQGCGHAGVGGSTAHPQVPQVCFVACGNNSTFPDGRLGCSTITPATNIQGIFNEHFTSCGSPDVCANHIGHCQNADEGTCAPAQNPGVAPGPDTIDCSFVVNENLTIGFIAENRIYANGAIDDKRSAGDIAAGCVPCAIAMGGAVVTVTDSFGSEAMVTITTED